MNDLIPGARGPRRAPLPRRGPLRAERRPGPGPQADRHGLPEAEPVPEVDLRQRRLRSACPRSCKDDLDETVERALRRRGALGRGQGPARRQRLRPVRRPAAAALHRPLHRGRARRDPDGRALLGAGPDLDRQDRGPDDRAEGGVLDRHRHAQHAAGGASLRPHRLPDGRARRDRAEPLGPAGRVRRDREDLHQPLRSAHRGLRAPARSAEADSMETRVHYQEELEELEASGARRPRPGERRARTAPWRRSSTRTSSWPSW